MPSSGRRRRRAIKQVGVQSALLFWAIVSVLPLVWVLSASLQSTAEIYSGLHLIPEQWRWSNYVEAWDRASFSTYTLNSITYTVCTVVGAVLISALAAYAFARMRFPCKNVVFVALLAFLFIPVPGAFIPLYVVLAKLGLLNTQVGYILPMINSNLPVGIFILRRFFEEQPIELEEAAFVDGASRLGIFWRIALPLARPAVATVVILTALGTWNEYILASVVFNDRDLMPLQVGLLTFQGAHFSQYGLMMAATMIATLPMLVVYVIFQKYVIKGVAAGALKG